jgi:hypothetical protein
VPTALNAIGVDKSEFMRGQVLEQIYPWKLYPDAPAIK